MADAETYGEHERAGQRTPTAPVPRPGSDGEHALQQRLGTIERADRFYDQQVLDHLNERMQEFVGRQEMFFLATSDSRGECDNSFRAGPPGFVQVLDERTLVYPEYRGNGVHASLGNLQENPHVGILLVDFMKARIGLHVNGRARMVEDDEMRTECPWLPEDPVPGRRARMWVRVSVQEAYIHCAKHIPHLQKAPKRSASDDWGTDDYKRKGGDFFGVARAARERGPVPRPPRQHPSVTVPAPAPVHGRPVRGPVYEPAPADAPSAVPEDLVPLTDAYRPGAVPTAWRREAERVLAEAERRAAQAEPSTFQGWFG